MTLTSSISALSISLKVLLQQLCPSSSQFRQTSGGRLAFVILISFSGGLRSWNSSAIRIFSVSSNFVLHDRWPNSAQFLQTMRDFSACLRDSTCKRIFSLITTLCSSVKIILQTVCPKLPQLWHIGGSFDAQGLFGVYFREIEFRVNLRLTRVSGNGCRGHLRLTGSFN